MGGCCRYRVRLGHGRCCRCGRRTSYGRRCCRPCIGWGWGSTGSRCGLCTSWCCRGLWQPISVVDYSDCSAPHKEDKCYESCQTNGKILVGVGRGRLGLFFGWRGFCPSARASVLRSSAKPQKSISQLVMGLSDGQYSCAHHATA